MKVPPVCCCFNIYPTVTEDHPGHDCSINCSIHRKKMRGPIGLTPPEGTKLRRNSLWLWTIFQFNCSLQRAALNASFVPGTLCQYIPLPGLRTLSKKLLTGIPGWRSGLAPAFGPGRDPGDPGSNPTSGSRCMEPASPSACVSASLSLSV